MLQPRTTWFLVSTPLFELTSSGITILALLVFGNDHGDSLIFSCILVNNAMIIGFEGILPRQSRYNYRNQHETQNPPKITASIRRLTLSNNPLQTCEEPTADSLKSAADELPKAAVKPPQITPEEHVRQTTSDAVNPSCTPEKLARSRRLADVNTPTSSTLPVGWLRLQKNTL
uniref:Uncharacterized protein n=1 Tax=Cucumis sativus TaxID=3659 RepID=A0A0A0KHQ9_CUCSA